MAWHGAADPLRLEAWKTNAVLRWRGQLQSQSGVVSREQARAAGFTEKAIAWRLRSGTWQRIHRGAYATFTGDLSREGRLWAAVLCVGPGAVLSHQTAAEVHGLTDKTSTRIHISVPAGQHPSRDRKIRGVVIHRSRYLAPEWQPPWQLPRTTVEDTVLDLIAAARSFDDAYGWISAAVGRRLTTPELLGKALAARSRMRWRAWVTDAGPPGGRPLARYPPRQRQPGAGNGHAEIRVARRHRAPLPDRRGDRRGPAPPRLDRYLAPLRSRLHRHPASQA